MSTIVKQIITIIIIIIIQKINYNLWVNNLLIQENVIIIVE